MKQPFENTNTNLPTENDNKSTERQDDAVILTTQAGNKLDQK